MDDYYDYDTPPPPEDPFPDYPSDEPDPFGDTHQPDSPTVEADPATVDAKLHKLDNAVADALGRLRIAEVKHEEIAHGQDATDPVKLTEAEERISKAERDLALARQVAAAAAEEAALVALAAGPDGQPADPEPEFSSVYQFVEEHLALIYARKWDHAGSTRLWCPRWFEHAEAVSRLEAIWRAYESLRLDPTLGMSVWWRDHVDPHMNQLINPEGPFEGCTTDKHKPRTAPMPCDRMDDELVRSAMSVDRPQPQ